MSESTSARPGGGQREMMFCHECHDEWYRDQHGIICPECESEFTEIIEDGNDPRDNAMSDHGHDDEDDDSLPSLEEADIETLRSHNPFRAAEDDDPDEADISQMRFQNARMQNTGPNTYRITATMSQTIPFSPAAFGLNGNGPSTIGGFASFLSNMLQGGGAQRPGQTQGQGQAEAGDGQGGSAPRTENGPHIHRHQFTYTPGARLQPRDPNNPGPRLEPVDDMNNVLAGLFAAFGQPTPNNPRGAHAHHDHGLDDMPMNPLMGLFAAISGGQQGDFVYSNEAMDRIVSQLMEQTSTSNAPGPAPQSAIDALPRKKVTSDMLGDDGKADCSICMDEVAPEEEVTLLPCKHWFHHQCVAAWLKEHDTCPHCRQGITQDPNAPKDGPSGRDNASSGADPTANMPGAFGTVGEGTSSNPFVIPGSSPPQQPPTDNTAAGSSAQQPQSSTAANDGSNGGLSVAEQVRRSWWP